MNRISSGRFSISVSAKMDPLSKNVAECVNDFIIENPTQIIKNWGSFIAQYSDFLNEKSLSLLELLSKRIPSLWDDILTYSHLPMSYARKHWSKISKSNYHMVLHECETDEDFDFVASHMGKLPHWITNENLKINKKFGHLLDKYEIDT